MLVNTMCFADDPPGQLRPQPALLELRAAPCLEPPSAYEVTQEGHRMLPMNLMRRVRHSVGRSVRVVRLLAAASILAVVAVSSVGCTPVAAYERGKLAHPTMSAGDMAGMGEQHLRAISEGAIGGSAGTGSGCGCN